MTDYHTSGVHKLNEWLWTRLQSVTFNDAGDLAFAEYAPNGSLNVVPIIPTQQVRNLNNIIGGAPYIVYNYTTTPSSTDWYRTREQCAYVIWDNNEQRLRAIQGMMISLLERYEWTAQEVNTFLGNNTTYDFKFVSVTSATSPGAATEQGGRQSGLVVALYEFSHDLDASGLRV